MMTVKMGLKHYYLLLSTITEALLVHCHIAKNDYQHDSMVSYTFVSNKLFGLLLDISPKCFMFLKSPHLKFLYF